jgi:carbon monoxide dehydrogenase subunit G
VEIKGEETIPGTREEVWLALTDPDILQECIPGCDSVLQRSPVDFDLEVLIRIGPIKSRFNGEMKIENPDHPRSYLLKAFGKGGGAGRKDTEEREQGFATMPPVSADALGEAKLELHEMEMQGPVHTRLCYRMDIHINGTVAQMGEQLIYVVGKQMTTQFFRRFQELRKTSNANRTDPAEDLEMTRLIERALKGDNWNPLE